MEYLINPLWVGACIVLFGLAIRSALKERSSETDVVENATTEPLQKKQQFSDSTLSALAALNRLTKRTNWHGGVNGASLDRIDYEIVVKSLEGDQ